MEETPKTKKVRNFYYTSLIGGFLVVLPMIILFVVFKWIFSFILEVLSPITALVMKTGPNELIAGLMAVVFILILCFLIGVAVRTRWGLNTHHTLEEHVMRYAPGYTLIKETINIFLGRKTQPFSKVALVRIFATPTLMTALVTDEHADGSYTVFVPTAPNPTSGNIYHLRPENVFLVNVPVEDAIRSILGCGAGSTKMIEMSSLNGRLESLESNIEPGISSEPSSGNESGSEPAGGNKIRSEHGGGNEMNPEPAGSNKMSTRPSVDKKISPDPIDGNEITAESPDGNRISRDSDRENQIKRDTTSGQ